MQSSVNYLPIAPAFFLLFSALFLVLAATIGLGVLRYAYAHLGLTAGGALLVLLASLIGSYVNIPVTQLPARHIMSAREVSFFGMHYVVPVTINAPGTIVAVNVGGCIVPVLLSIYLVARLHASVRAAIAVIAVGAIVHFLADPLPGVGIAVPIFVPPIAAALIAMILSWRDAAAIAYVGGSLGTLIGADLTNLGQVQDLGAPVASIGGAGTFDGIFLTGLIAVLLASLPGWISEPEPGTRTRW